MLKMNSRIITLAAVLVFAVSVLLSYYFQRYELAVSGMLIIIVLTAFIPGWRSTLVAGLLGMIVMTAMVIYFKNRETDIGRALLSQVFSLLILLFSVILIFYLKKMQLTFAHEKTHMASLFENATEGILLTNKSGTIVLANPAAERIFGFSSTEMVGSKIELLIPNRYHHHHNHLRDAFYHQPSNRSMGVGRDLFARRKDGSEFPVEVSLSHYQQRNETFVIAFIVDITTRKMAEQKSQAQKLELEKISQDIRKLNAELEGKVEERTLILKEALIKLEESQMELSESLDKERQLNEIKSRFVSMASHEFRTPLSTILSSATLVSKYPTTEEFDKRERHIRRIRDSVNHMNALLEDFLSLGKLEEGKVSINISSFNLREFTDDIIDEMKANLKPGQEILQHCEGEALFSTDKRMLKNIFLNLLSNAIKFSPENKPIQVSTINTGTQLKVVVADEGLGIPEDDQPYLFSTFFRAKNVSNIQGTGLGLPIIKRYIGLLKGDINFNSRPGQTVFSVTLPALNEKESAA